MKAELRTESDIMPLCFLSFSLSSSQILNDSCPILFFGYDKRKLGFRYLNFSV